MTPLLSNMTIFSFFGSKSLIEAGTGNGSRTCTGYYDFDLFNFFIRQFQCIDQCSTRDDGRSMLVIMHQGNVQFCFESIFDLKCLGGLYVFKVDASECGAMAFTVWINFSVSFSLISISKTSMSANILNKSAFPSITGFEASGPISPKPEQQFRLK